MENSKIISSYYSYSPGDPLQPEGIDGSLLTHLIVGWANIDPTGQLIYDPKFEDGFARCVLLKKEWPILKVMLTCGGGGKNYSNTAVQPALRAEFIRSALATVDKFGFDGLDIDWEFPVWSGQKSDRQSFVEWLRDLRAAFNNHEPRLALSIATSAAKLIIDPAYDIPGIAPSVDFVNLMCYDINMFQSYYVWASHNAPLFKRPEQLGFFATLNTAWAADYWLEKGLPRKKLVVGVPTYARSWKLLFPCWHGYGAVCTGPGIDNGFLSYPQVMEMIVGGAKRVFDQHACVPYCSKGQQWISYEDEESIKCKAEWIRKNDFGGAMIFALNFDDYKGVFSSSGKPFPLISIMSSIVRK